MSATEYLYAVQDETGRELCAYKVTPDKVGDVHAEMRSGQVALVQDGLGDLIVVDTHKQADQLTFLRWPADDKLADPVRHKVVNAD